MRDDDRRLVYSSESGYQAPPRRENKPNTGSNSMPQDGIIRVARERRRASMVSLVHGVAPGEIDTIAKTLKKYCGTGGTAKSGVIEIQGDHREKIVAWFAAQGKKAKLAGG